MTNRLVILLIQGIQQQQIDPRDLIINVAKALNEFLSPINFHPLIDIITLLLGVIVLISGIRIIEFFFGKLLSSLLWSDEINQETKEAQELLSFDQETKEAQKLLSFLLPPQDTLYGSNLTYPLKLTYRLINATTVSGDYLNYIKGENNIFGIYLVDVEGHGFPAAMQVTNLYQLFNSAVEGTKWGMNSPQKGLKTADRLVKESSVFQKMEAIFCLNFTEINLNTMKLRHANAGMPFPLLFRSGKVEPEIIQASGLYVGAGFGKFEEKEVNIEKGDLLVIFSDGITEATNNKGQIFGRSGIQKVITKNRDKSIKDIADEIIKAVKKHSDREQPEDDQALVVVSIGE